MDVSKLELLTQVRIEEPCQADWDAMSGDEQRRHCSQCGCDVHNVEALSVVDADALLNTTERVCLRMMVDDQRNVLTRDGWIPRMILAGAMASAVAGCGQVRESGTARVVPTKSVPVAKTSAIAGCGNARVSREVHKSTKPAD